jgi:hypothetical protein
MCFLSDHWDYPCTEPRMVKGTNEVMCTQHLAQW